MKRNQAFAPDKRPFQGNQLELDESKTGAPFSFLNPTRAKFLYADSPETFDQAQEGSTSVASESSKHRHGPVNFIWRSRDNRKGRHTLQITKSLDEDNSIATPQPTSRLRPILNNILRLFTVFKPWDISWLVAQIFVWGSIVWCINGFFALLPLTNSSTDFPNEIVYGGGISAFIGAIVFFETGSILLVLEAVNENDTGCFGWALEQIHESTHSSQFLSRLSPDLKCCSHHHSNQRNLVGSGIVRCPNKDHEESGHPKTWTWFPSWHVLVTHYLHELGFLACLAQLIGASIFGISGITALPGIENQVSQRVLNGIYWVPQIVGGSGFIVSGILFMLETQTNWYTPALDVLGWHIGLWNLVGAFGFTLSGALGPAYGNSGAQFQAAVATFWGSWAFLLASVLQLYESVEKHPVQLAKS